MNSIMNSSRQTKKPAPLVSTAAFSISSYHINIELPKSRLYELDDRQRAFYKELHERIRQVMDVRFMPGNLVIDFVQDIAEPYVKIKVTGIDTKQQVRTTDQTDNPTYDIFKRAVTSIYNELITKFTSEGQVPESEGYDAA